MSYTIEVSQYSFDYQIPDGVNFNFGAFSRAIETKLEQLNVYVVGIDYSRDVDDWGEFSDMNMHQCGIDFIDINRIDSNGIDIEAIINEICQNFGVTIYGDDYDSTDYYGLENDIADFYDMSIDELLDMLYDAGYDYWEN